MRLEFYKSAAQWAALIYVKMRRGSVARRIRSVATGATVVVNACADCGCAGRRGAIISTPIDSTIDAGDAHRRQRSSNSRVCSTDREGRRVRRRPVNRDWSGAQDCSDNSDAEGPHNFHDVYSFPPSAREHRPPPATKFDPSQFHKKLFAFRSGDKVLSEDTLVTKIFPDSTQNRQCVAASTRPCYPRWITIRSRHQRELESSVEPLDLRLTRSS